jgi:DNA/RNA endonuclease G (NUC1)
MKWPATIAVLIIAGTGPVHAQTCAQPDRALALASGIDEAMGFPILQDDTLDGGELKKICHDRFCVLHNGKTKTSVYVIEALDRDLVTGDNGRPKVGFKPDPSAPTDRRANDDDYKHSSLARGHLAASNDFRCDDQLMKNTFVLSNAVPQVQNGFNGSYWRYLEDRV